MVALVEKKSDEYTAGEMVGYKEGNALCKVQIVKNKSDKDYERYDLRLVEIYRKAPLFEEGDIGDEWDYLRSKIGGGAPGMGYLFPLSDLESMLK
ncbi:hypothetical protein KW805_04655 [Candidatus Pacearchaeota archaeon]|nr:hypothetical protein [Candidatus Pacearchaeota archaeon]